ncbi:MAG: rRNA (cytosine-C5-)-methyltransferase nop2 [Vezdaea aestivalis]|nr:MAG: rRNA (cytosine-C5-)-methyltransferase nop2 [Vezdaea aestivalis]
MAPSRKPTRSRRMTKQGPPAPLDESLVTRKRKAAELLPHSSDKKRKPQKPNQPQQTFKKVIKASIQKPVPSKKSKTKAPLPSKNVGRLGEAFDDEDDEDKMSGMSLGGDDGPSADSIDDGLLDDTSLPSDNDPLASGSSVYDSDPGVRKSMFSDDEGSSDGEERLTAANIEGLSRQLDRELSAEADDARVELHESTFQTNIRPLDPTVPDDFQAGSEAESDAEADPALRGTTLAPDLQLLRSRITDSVRILSSFSALADPARSRSEYTAQLLKDISAYYGYSIFLATKLYSLFSPAEAFAFFEANETARPTVIRTNTLRTHRRDLAQALINRGVVLEPVGKWSKVGLQIFDANVPLGATPEYLAGHYILQAASSFLPVMALAPQEHERVLDMAAAPGGKTTYIAALMKNTGCVFANDSNKERAKGLIGNVHRLGAKNTIICNYDAREFPRVMGGFDRVLLDAPCSGTGVIAKDPTVKTSKTHRDFLALPHLQKQLLLAAIDSVDHSSKTGGYIVYSTCSVTVEENEGVVAYALRKRPNIKIVDSGLVFGKEGFTSIEGKKFDQSIKMARRYYPHAHNMDGFFVVKFKKTGPSPAGSEVQAGEIGGTASVDLDTDVEMLDEEDTFGDWDNEEDEKIIEIGRKRALRKKGLNPKIELNGSRQSKGKDGKREAESKEPSNGDS